LLEAIAFAGDLTLYARRDNILLIREVAGKRITKHINLNDQELFTSPYYYLQSNDVIYVTPNKSKIQSTGNARLWLPFAIASITLGIVIFDRLN
jgi:polysaccharide export outer membrane protein